MTFARAWHGGQSVSASSAEPPAVFDERTGLTRSSAGDASAIGWSECVAGAVGSEATESACTSRRTLALHRSSFAR